MAANVNKRVERDQNGTGKRPHGIMDQGVRLTLMVEPLNRQGTKLGTIQVGHEVAEIRQRKEAAEEKTGRIILRPHPDEIKRRASDSWEDP